MTWWARRRGFFEGPPRTLYRRTGARYFNACALLIVLNGVAVAGFGVVVIVLYVDLSLGELALFAACLVVAYALEAALAAKYFLKAAEPARAWLARDGAGGPAAAWLAAARLPLMLVRRPALNAAGALGAAGSDVLVTRLLGLPTYQAALLFPMSYLLYVSCGVLRYVGLDLCMRPVLGQIGERLPELAVPGPARVTLHQRLLATVPMVTWGTALIVGGLVTSNARRLGTVGLATGVAFGVTAAVSMWLSLVLADAVSAPIRDLRDATRRVASGDLTVQVPVVSTDETGELTASFNSMVAGLREREKLHEAFGAFVDPALTERVLAEGTDL
jgi:HAMP domain-containing protein